MKLIKLGEGAEIGGSVGIRGEVRELISNFCHVLPYFIKAKCVLIKYSIKRYPLNSIEKVALSLKLIAGMYYYYRLIYSKFSIKQIMSTVTRALGKFEILRSKFNKNTTLKLKNIVEEIAWSSTLSEICEQLNEITEEQLGGKYVWMIGENPAYFVQHQVDSYAMMKGRDRVVLVWKPKYIQFPNVLKPIDFGAQPKIIKSMTVTTTETSLDDSTAKIQELSKDFILKFYGSRYFSTKEVDFETELMNELKNYISRNCATSYWHCGIDDHNRIGVSSRAGPYIKIRVKGVRQKYDKDIVVFSHKGKRDFILKGKAMQILSFFAMLIIFISVISCGDQDTEGVCVYKNEMMIGGAAIMMGLMGMRVVNRNKNKKNLQAKIRKLEKQEKKQ